MAIIVGTGDFKYRIIEDWAKLPDGWSFKEVGAVGVDNRDNVYVFNRGDHPIMVFDRNGNFLRSWGGGQYPRAHGVHMGPDDSIYLTDDGGHFVRKCSLDGKVLLEIGVPGKPAPYMSGGPFHRSLAERRDLRVRRLWQRQGAQILAGRKIADVVGRTRHRRGRVQHRAQY